MSGAIAEVQAGAEAAKTVEEAVTGAFTCAADCLDTTIKMKHEIDKEAHDDAEIYTIRESYVKNFVDNVAKLAGEKFNIIVVREYQADHANFQEASPQMPLFEVEYEAGKLDHYRVYLFTAAEKYIRTWPGGSWKGDGIQWYPNIEAKYPSDGQMYLEGFPVKQGMTEDERKALGTGAAPEAAPEGAAPEEAAPEEPAPESPAPEEAAPEEPAPEEPAPEEPAPEEPAPEEPAPEEAAPEEPAEE